jgi:hypothetical protein
MRRFGIILVIAVCGLAVGVPAASAKPPFKQERYLAWLELDVTDSWRLHRETIEAGCRRTSRHGLAQRLILRSGSQSILVATRKPRGGTSTLAGTLRALGGTLTGSGSGADFNSCTQGGVVTDYGLPMISPITISDATIDVRADPGREVVFSNFNGTASREGTERLASALANALNLATASVTGEHFYEATVGDVAVTGSFYVETQSADGAELRSMKVAWKLTIHAVLDKHALRIE